MTQLEIWAMLAQSALNYIFIQIVSGGNQRAIIKDVKTDLRTTKEDLLSELKDTRESILAEQRGKDGNN